ncbi:MAG: hypothetical protein J7M38_12445 [Armatimonadetes bacterium]|nr:hypothetical protein [Armatimonadota bacterium]
MQLLGFQQWPDNLQIQYHAPNRESVALEPEVHARFVRVTVPELATWGVIEIAR